MLDPEKDKNYWDNLNNMLDPEKNNNSKKFWKYIKSRKQDAMGIGTLKNRKLKC
jgi:hypothetical protein